VPGSDANAASDAQKSDAEVAEKSPSWPFLVTNMVADVAAEGAEKGAAEGATEGTAEGAKEGHLVGSFVGVLVGIFVGAADADGAPKTRASEMDLAPVGLNNST
jgi:hypothetical protein